MNDVQIWKKLMVDHIQILGQQGKLEIYQQFGQFSGVFAFLYIWHIIYF